MERRQIEENNGILEVVVNENGKIIFAKKITTNKAYQDNDTITTISGYGRITDMVKDVGFSHLEKHDFPSEAVVDYQYVDLHPENEFSNAKLGTLRVYDKEGKLVSGESFGPNRFTRIVWAGELKEDPDGIMMTAPKLLKEIVGKNIDEVIKDSNKDITR